MPRSTNIYGPRTNQAVRRAVKNFNAKISRELKKDPAAAAWLPERVSVKAFKAENVLRKDVNASLERLRRFSTPGAALPVELNPGLVRSVWEVKETFAAAAAADKRRARELRRMKPSTERGTMGLVEQHNLRPIRIHPEKMSLADWKAKQRTAEREAKAAYDMLRMIEYKANYLTAVRNTLGPFGEPILKLLQNVSPGRMVEGYKNNPVLNIDFLYDPQEAAFIALNVLEAWQEFLGLPNTAEEDIGGIADESYLDLDL